MINVWKLEKRFSSDVGANCHCECVKSPYRYTRDSWNRLQHADSPATTLSSGSSAPSTVLKPCPTGRNKDATERHRT